MDAKADETPVFNSMISPTDPRDFTILMVLLAVLKSVVTSSIASWIFRYRGLEPSRVESRSGQTEKKQKFVMALWKGLYFGVLATYGIIVLSRESWVGNERVYPLPYSDPYSMPYRFRIYYLVSFAFYLNELVCLFLEPSKKDFWQMFVHHLATIMVMWLSYTHNLTRYGLMILCIHDISDPFLEFAKVCVALNFKTAANILFSIFATVFVVSRLGVYPWFLVRPASRDLFLLRPSVWSRTIVGMLNILVVLHVMWAYLIGRMAHRLIVYGDGEDVREK